MKIYVAGSSKERDTIRPFLADLRANGHTLTFDWVAAIDKDESQQKGDDVLQPAQSLHLANTELQAVKAAELFWLIAPLPENPTRGGWVELGYALGLVCTVIVSGVHRRKCLFTELCDYSFDFHGEAFAKIVELGQMFDRAKP